MGKTCFVFFLAFLVLLLRVCFLHGNVWQMTFIIFYTTAANGFSSDRPLV